MVRLVPDLSEPKAFGTDDELNLYNAFESVFRGASHLLCSIHLRDNIEKALTKCGVENHERYIKEIFGQKTRDNKIKGLLDSMAISLVRTKVETPPKIFIFQKYFLLLYAKENLM